MQTTVTQVQVAHEKGTVGEDNTLPLQGDEIPSQ